MVIINYGRNHGYYSKNVIPRFCQNYNKFLFKKKGEVKK